jgi:Protein of unknown function (DUF2637)
MTMPADQPAGRDWWVLVGMTVAAASAAVASFSGLRGLAEAAGWPARLAWLLPLTIDAYAMTSARVWLAATTRTPAARRFARANALGAIAASTAGNAAYHALAAGLLTVTWPIVVAVGAVPATVLGLTAHLHALRSRTAVGPTDRDGTGDRTESDTEQSIGDGPRDRTESRPESGPSTTDGTSRSRTGDRSRTATRTPARRTGRRRTRTDAEILAAAQDADTRYRAEHGRPITRDALRTALRISGPRATELRRRLANPTPPEGVAATADRQEVPTT